MTTTPTAQQQQPQEESAVSKWTHRITLGIFWTAFGSFLATSIPHVAWLYQSFEPKDGAWQFVASYGIALGIDVMIAWLSFVQTIGKSKGVWFTWVFIVLLGVLSWYANYLYDMQHSPIHQIDIWTIELLGGWTTTGYITPIIISAIPLFAIAYTLMLSKLGARKVESVEEMRARLTDLQQRKEVEKELKALNKGRVKQALTSVIDDSREVFKHARTRVQQDAQSASKAGDEQASTEEEREEEEAVNPASSREEEHEQSLLNPRAGADEHPDDDTLWYGLSPRATVSIEKAAELLGLSANYVKSLRGKALKTAPRNKNQITIASIKQYKSRQLRRTQPTKTGTIKPALTIVPDAREEESMIVQASGS
jgi:hypothetical protein